jgi:Na+/H+-dicarboxylate symporter
MPLLGTVVDWRTLGEVVGYSLLAVVGLSIAFSLTILGVTRFQDMRRAGREVGAALYAALAVFGMLATTLALVLGIVVMTTKG